MLHTAFLSRVYDSLGLAGAQRDPDLHSSGRGAAVTTASVAGGGVAGLLILTTAYLALPRSPDSVLLRALPFALFFVFFGAMVTTPARSRGREARAAGDAARASVHFTDAGISFGGTRVAPSVGWSAFCRYGETQNAFVLYSSSGLVHVIPKNGLGDPGRIHALRVVLRANVERKGMAGSPIA